MEPFALAALAFIFLDQEGVLEVSSVPMKALFQFKISLVKSKTGTSHKERM